MLGGAPKRWREKKGEKQKLDFKQGAHPQQSTKTRIPRGGVKMVSARLETPAF